MIRILVGDSQLKFEATEQAIELIGLEAVIVRRKVSSRVPPNPYGRDETLKGAWNRASVLKLIEPSAYCVGIESGLIACAADVRDFTYVTVITPSGRRFVRKSIGVIVPPEIVKAVLNSKQLQTSGEFEAARSGCKPFDPHVIWSKGQTDRRRILTTVLYSALFAATIHEEGEIP
jgi:non-canonical (house-cleaning) NTP pyrophosphatase